MWLYSQSSSSYHGQGQYPTCVQWCVLFAFGFLAVTALYSVVFEIFRISFLTIQISNILKCFFFNPSFRGVLAKKLFCTPCNCQVLLPGHRGSRESELPDQ